MSIRDSFGKPKEGGAFKIITIGEGESKVVRFFPPMKTMAAKGIWARYVKQHYGYGIKDKKNPDGKLRLRPFECIEEKEESGLVTVSCPECRNVENMEQLEKDALALRTSDLQKEGVDKKTLEAELEKVRKTYAVWHREHNLDCKWLIPVKTEDGQFGLLKIPHKGKKAIDKVRAKEKGKKKSVDMLDIDAGFLVRITRTGTGLQTDYDAEPVTETRQVDGVGEVEVIKAAPLSDADLEQAVASIPDLGSSTLIRHLTKEQIQMLVDSKGVPDVVETVLNMSQKVKTTDNAALTDEDDVAEAPAPAPVQAKTPAPTPTPAPAPAAPVVQAAAPAAEDEEAELMRKLEEARARKAAAAKPAATPVAAAAPTGATPAAAKASNPLDPSMSDDEFMKRYGPGSSTAVR